MKNILLIGLMSSFYFIGFTQRKSQVHKLISTKSYKATADAGLAYAFVDAPPGFVGGQERWLSYQMRSPILKDALQSAKEQNMPAGKYTVTISFAVNPDGSIRDVRETGKAIGYGLDEAAIKFIEGSGRWVPADTDGKNAQTTVSVPVSFTLVYCN